MSLINKMLKDLDARQARATEAGDYLNQVRASAGMPRRGIPLAWAGAGVLFAAVAGAGGWTLLRPMLARSAAAPAVTAAAPASVAPVLASLPAPVVVPTVAPVPVAAVPASAPAQSADAPAIAVAPPEPATAPARLMPPSALSGPVPLREDKPAGMAQAVATETATTAATASPSASAKTAPSRRAAPVPSSPASSPDEAPPSAGTGMTEAVQAKVFTPQQRIDNDYRKAVGWIQQGRLDDAAALLEQVLRAEPGHAPARQALIGVLIDGRRLDEAQKLARDGLAQDPAQPGLAMILGRLQLEKGELRSAIETLERSQPHAVSRADYQAFLAALLQRDNRHKDAVDHYLLALQQNPRNGVWWMGMAISLQADNRRADAREAYLRAKSSGSLNDELQGFVDARLQQIR